MNYESSGLSKASSLLAHHDWSWSRRRRWLGSAGNETGNGKGEDSVFHRMYRGVCLALIVAVVARENVSGLTINRDFANIQIDKMHQNRGLMAQVPASLAAQLTLESAWWGDA